LRKRLEDSEKTIETLEAEINAIDKSFMEPGNNTEKHEQDYFRYQDLKEQLNKEMDCWTQFSQEVDDFIKTNG
jgi:hypothetical protein